MKNNYLNKWWKRTNEMNKKVILITYKFILGEPHTKIYHNVVIF